MQSLKTAIGLMSGTSMDGIDAALIRSDGERHLEILAHMSFDYPANFRRQLKQALDIAPSIKERSARPGMLGKLERELTFYHAQLVQHLLAKQAMSCHEVDLIGFHGQTIVHHPQEGLSVQLGLGQELARQTGIDVIYDMRANDLAHGGQGAPMVPVYHAVLAQILQDKLNFPCCFVNIGGIANLTYIPTANRVNFEEIMAFDCGPGNCLIDQWMERKRGLDFDAGGQAGLRGNIDETLLASYQQHDIFTRPQPQSLDWGDFPLLCDDDMSVEDGAATLAYLSALAITGSFRFLPQWPKTLIISGGGRKNLCLMAALTKLAAEKGAALIGMEECGLERFPKSGNRFSDKKRGKNKELERFAEPSEAKTALDADFIEAQAWAYLAIRASQGLPLSFPKTTGVQFPVTGGILALASQ